jgi:hypothetical protein
MSEFGKTFKFFHSEQKMAITCQLVVAEAGYPTIAIELAVMSYSNNKWEADWDNKWTFQVSFNEMSSVAAVLLGITPKIEYKYHGKKHKVAYALQRNSEGRVRIVIQNGGPHRTIVLQPGEVFWLSTLLFDAIGRNTSGGISKDMLFDLIRHTQPIST